MIDFDSNQDSGFAPDPRIGIPDPWLSNLRDPLMTFGLVSMQDAVATYSAPNGSGNYKGGNTGCGWGWGYGNNQGGVMYGYGDFIGILADDQFGYTALGGMCYYRSGAGAPPLENLSVQWPGDCGAIQSVYVYPRDALSTVCAIGGVEGQAASTTLPGLEDQQNLTGAVTGLPFQPNLILARWAWNGNFDGNMSIGWGACGSDLTQFGCAIQGGSWRPFSIRSHAFHSGMALPIYYENDRVLEFTIDSITSDGFTYTYDRFDTGHTSSAGVGHTWTVHFHCFRFPSDEVLVGIGENGDATVDTPWRPEGIWYASANCPEGHSNPGGNFALGASMGVGMREQAGMQRVIAGGHGGRVYADGVICFQSYTPFEADGISFARQTITANGADLDWPVLGGNSKKFGYVAWGLTAMQFPYCNIYTEPVSFRSFDDSPHPSQAIESGATHAKYRARDGIHLPIEGDAPVHGNTNYRAREELL